MLVIIMVKVIGFNLNSILTNVYDSYIGVQFLGSILYFSIKRIERERSQLALFRTNSWKIRKKRELVQENSWKIKRQFDIPSSLKRVVSELHKNMLPQVRY